jgi:UPF0176 protein
MQDQYHILLYYCYTNIVDPISFREEHHRYCLQLGLKGRIIVAHEGLNGTVSGTLSACETYMATLKADPRFSHTQFKVEKHNQHAFQKLHIRIKPEIVHANLPHVNPNKKTGQYISPQQLQQLKAEEEVVLLDVRSKYEHRIGKFKDAVTLDINHFREFPTQLAKLADYKDKKIVTYCTGGIKCEKASAYLLEQGFKNVYQLHGGIIQYGLDTNGMDFEGKCYVFDNRLTTMINKVNPTIIAHCYVCNTACERLVNCANPWCNLHTTICTSCGEQLEGACSELCRKHPDKRPYDGTGYYPTKMNGYNPYKGAKRTSTTPNKLNNTLS